MRFLRHTAIPWFVKIINVIVAAVLSHASTTSAQEAARKVTWDDVGRQQQEDQGRQQEYTWRSSARHQSAVQIATERKRHEADAMDRRPVGPRIPTGANTVAVDFRMMGRDHDDREFAAMVVQLDGARRDLEKQIEDVDTPAIQESGSDVVRDRRSATVPAIVGRGVTPDLPPQVAQLQSSEAPSMSDWINRALSGVERKLSTPLWKVFKALTACEDIHCDMNESGPQCPEDSFHDKNGNAVQPKSDAHE